MIVAAAGITALLWALVASMHGTSARASDAACDPAALEGTAQHPSPNKRYAAVGGTVVDAEEQRCQIVAEAGARFVGWTADGRYAVFNTDQGGAIFDAGNWVQIPVSFEEAGRAFDVMALAPVMRRVLFEDGSLLFLGNAEQYSLLDRDDEIAAAAFSPGEQFLAVVVHHGDTNALYVADGDGDNLHRVMPLDTLSYDIAIQWNQDDTPKFTLQVGEHRWQVNVWTGEIDALD
jgi:hypothetical protein